MPSPLGHTLVSSSIYLFFKKDFSFKKDFRNLILFIGIGLLPDIDMLLVLLSRNIGIHRSVTHSLIFVIFSSIVVYLFLKKLKILSFKNSFLLILSLLSAHLFCDFFTLDDILHNGINLFYPFSKEYIPAPFYLFMGFDWRQFSTLFSFYMLKVIIREFIITAPFFILALLYINKTQLKEEVNIESQN
ncbi:MAG: hypothetical protein A2166_02615 [Omnitrophica WOR_2 bacterium RBG_13_41_10]|nr:MAG: hypothetical protein A2166_02615 [Omnitrophica WOR_2 bacterium RBG_13_41_10]